MPKPGPPFASRSMRNVAVTVSTPRKTGLRELEEGARPVREPETLRRQAVLLLARHLTEGSCKAVGLEHGVVAEAIGAARRPNQGAVDSCLEFFHVAIRPGHAQRRDEMGAAIVRLESVALAQHAFDFLHGVAKILFRARPARRMDAGRAVERLDREARIVRERGESRRHRGELGLDACVLAKARARFGRLIEMKFAGRDRLDSVRREQLAHLGELARIVGCDDEPARDRPPHAFPCGACWILAAAAHAHITAIFCSSTSLAMPWRASASSAANCSSLKGIFSAVACTSTRRPSPVMTKLASVSASESSI